MKRYICTCPKCGGEFTRLHGECGEVVSEGFCRCRRNGLLKDFGVCVAIVIVACWIIF